jgi:RNA:NAD 2'-phosphotransferase (TPT1/KptA family)
MAQRHQRGWLKKEKRAQGETWVLFFRTTRQSDRMLAAGKMLSAILSHAPDKNGLTAD